MQNKNVTATEVSDKAGGGEYAAIPHTIVSRQNTSSNKVTIEVLLKRYQEFCDVNSIYKQSGTERDSKFVRRLLNK